MRKHMAGLPMNHHRAVPVFFASHEDNHHRSMPVMKKSPTPHHVGHARHQMPNASSPPLCVFRFVGSCLPNKTELFLMGKMDRVGLPDYFRVIIVSDPITRLAKRVMFVYRLIV